MRRRWSSCPIIPSLLDALMILSRVPNTNCIMKAGIVHSLFFGAGARLMGFIPNTPLRAMVHLATADLHRGSHVLLFPEGTRTTRFPINELQGTAGLIAKHAKVPIQTIFIETNSGFLGKGWSLLWTPRMPITFRIRLGKRFDTAHAHHAIYRGTGALFPLGIGPCRATRLPHFRAGGLSRGAHLAHNANEPVLFHPFCIDPQL